MDQRLLGFWVGFCSGLEARLTLLVENARQAAGARVGGVGVIQVTRSQSPWIILNNESLGGTINNQPTKGKRKSYS